MFTQEELHRVLQARIRAAGPRRPRAAPAIAVLRTFDPCGFVRSVLDFTAWLPPAERHDWQADFTRAAFLAGNPRNLAGRLPPAVVSDDGDVAWYPSGSGPRQRELRLLLRAVRGQLSPDLPERFGVEVPPHAQARSREPKQWLMAVGTAGLSLPRYLVHVSHTLAEARLTGVLAPGDRLTVRHVPYLSGLDGEYAYLRVHQDEGDPQRLRAYAGITEQGRRD